MKMCREKLSEIEFPTQFAHDLRDRQLRKWSMGLQTECQQIGEHFDQQSRVQTVTLLLHRANLGDRIHHLPEAFNHMVLLPNVPYLRSSQRHLTLSPYTFFLLNG